MSYNIYNATTDSLEKVSGRVSNGILNTLSEVKESASENVASGSLAVKELADGEVYSTTETKTNKVWIDGKPIYRRVFNNPSQISINAITWASVNISIPNIERMTDYRYINNAYADSTVLLFISARHQNGTINVYNARNGAVTLGTNGLHVFEYTKTTD